MKASTNHNSQPSLPWLLFAAVALFLFVCGPVVADPKLGESPQLKQLIEQVQSGDQTAEEAFWNVAVEVGLPIVEDGTSDGSARLTFLLHAGVDGADPRNARLAMMIPERPLYQFTPVAGTQLWSITLEVSNDAMAMYWLAWPRGRTGHPDTVFAYPHRDGMHYEFFADPNAKQYIKGTISPEFPDKPMSVFFASPDKELSFAKPRQGLKQGQLLTESLDSQAFGTSRDVSVYLPNGYSAQCGHPWAIVFDADQYLSLMSFTTVMDNLIADEEIPPMAAVLVHTGASRVPDLAPNPRMQSFVRDELVPWARQSYGFSKDNQKTAVMGFSHGGLAALYAGLKNPDLIGAVVAHSSSAWWSSTLMPPLDLMKPMPEDAGELARGFGAAEKLALRFYIDVGTWEGHWQIESNQQLQSTLADKGYSVSYHTYEGGHDYLAWREMLPGALGAIFEPPFAKVACSNNP